MIQVDNLNLSFGRKPILKDINFCITQGQICGLFGPNGAGKTTLIKCIYGIINFDSGKITSNNKEINLELAKDFAFFPDQNNMPLYFKTIDYIKYIAKLSSIPSEEYKIRLKNIIEMIKIENLLNKKIKKLSSGEKKKIALAGVLIKKPKVIFFDEPTANLDIAIREDFLKIFNSLKKANITMIITTHIFNDIENIIERLLIIDKGSLIYNNSFNHKEQKIEDIYLNIIDTSKEQIDDNIVGKIYD